MAATATDLGMGIRRSDRVGAGSWMLRSDHAGGRPFGRPLWRGRLHGWAIIVAIPAGIHLVASVDPGPMRAAAATYAVGLVLVFATSSAYHLATSTERSRALMQRIDHSMIYVLIGGTVTPVLIGVLPRSWWLPMLALVSGCAGSGVALALFAFDRLRTAIYVMYPVTAVAPLGVSAHQLAPRLSVTQMVLLLAGGLVYAVGLPVLKRRRPDPWPERFGYHEVFHAATIVAAVLHYAAVRDLLH